MPISYTIDRDSEIVYRTFTGVVGYEDFAQHWLDLLSDPELPVEGPLLLVGDMRKAKIDLNGESVGRLVRREIKPLIKDRKWISAIVVGSAADFGTTRQFSFYTEDCGETGIFYDLEEALSWLANFADGKGRL